MSERPDQIRIIDGKQYRVVRTYQRRAAARRFVIESRQECKYYKWSFNSKVHAYEVYEKILGLTGNPPTSILPE